MGRWQWLRSVRPEWAGGNDVKEIDKLHGDIVCSLGLYLHGSEITDRAAALESTHSAINALAREAERMVQESDDEIARLKVALAAGTS